MFISTREPSIHHSSSPPPVFLFIFHSPIERQNNRVTQQTISRAFNWAVGWISSRKAPSLLLFGKQLKTRRKSRADHNSFSKCRWNDYLFFRLWWCHKKTFKFIKSAARTMRFGGWRKKSAVSLSFYYVSTSRLLSSFSLKGKDQKWLAIRDVRYPLLDKL